MSDHVNSPSADAPPARVFLSGDLQAPIIYCLLLLGAATHQHSFWGYLWEAICLVFLAVAAHTTFSTKEFEAERRRDPPLTRREHMVKQGVPYLLFPLAGWLLVVFGWSAGVIVPALPWVLMYIVFALAAASQAVARTLRRGT